MVKFKQLALLLITFQIIGSCKFDDDNRLNNDQLPDIRVTNGYLHFKNYDVFNEAYGNLANLDQEARLSWLSGFRDYESFFHFKVKIMEAEYKFSEKLSKMSENELQVYNTRFLQGEKIHSPLVDENHEYLVFLDDNDFYFKIGIPEDYYPLVNKEGVVKIGDRLVKYTENYQYSILDGDEDKLIGIEHLTKSSPEQGIEVMKIGRAHIPEGTFYDPTIENGKVQNCGGPLSPFQHIRTQALIGCGRNGPFRVRGFVEAWTVGNVCPGIVNKKQFTIKVQNQRRIGFFWLANGTNQLSITVRSFSVGGSNYPDGRLVGAFEPLNPTPLGNPNLTITVTRTVGNSEWSWPIWETECNYTSSTFNLTNTPVGLSAIFRGQNFTEFNTFFAPCDC